MINDGNLEFKREGALVRQFIIKTVVKAFIIAVVAFLAYIITDTPILTNQVAMGQMENSNDWFVAMHMYQKFADVAGSIRNVLCSILIGTICYDGYSLAKNLKT